MEVLTFKNLDLTGLSKAAQELADYLQKHEPFVCFLDGEMGAGKTTLVGLLLRAYGLDPKVPVQSPTFTYMNEHQVGERWFAHMDLYRCDEHFDLAETGVLDKVYAGIFIEWPKVGRAEEFFEVDFRIELATSGEGVRDLVLHDLSSHPAT